MNKLKTILNNLNEWWMKNISVDSAEECMLTFPFVDKYNDCVSVYLTMKPDDKFTVAVILDNPPANNIINYGCTSFKRDKEVKKLYSADCSIDRLSMTITDAICLPIIYN